MALTLAFVRVRRLTWRAFAAALRWVVLSCPPAVLEDPRFVGWAAQLGPEVQCVVANEQCGAPTHLFPASAGVHVRLGALEPALFPPLQPETGAAQPVAGMALEGGDHLGAAGRLAVKRLVDRGGWLAWQTPCALRCRTGSTWRIRFCAAASCQPTG